MVKCPMDNRDCYRSECHKEDICISMVDSNVKPILKNDPVNNPSHYTSGKIEVIDFIEDQKLNFHLGNAVKYISRAGKKDPNKYREDLQKAIWYIERHLKSIA